MLTLILIEICSLGLLLLPEVLVAYNFTPLRRFSTANQSVFRKSLNGNYCFRWTTETIYSFRYFGIAIETFPKNSAAPCFFQGLRGRIGSVYVL